ncbi:MAG: GNAT family N-acetyltransferase [Actinomycetota bacterium]|nr:GNAT family N-acetyltransferase [Actinomycetota bacterium]
MQPVFGAGEVIGLSCAADDHHVCTKGTDPEDLLDVADGLLGSGSSEGGGVEAAIECGGGDAVEPLDLGGVEAVDGGRRSKDERSAFDCGNEDLSSWLARYASQAMASRDAVTYLLHEEREIIGYFTLSSASVSKGQAGDRLAKRAPNPVPMILLGRMGVHVDRKGRGLGWELVRQALRRAASSAEDIGARGLMLHAIDEAAQSFYLHLGFEESPITPRLMLIPSRDISATMASLDKSAARQDQRST